MNVGHSYTHAHTHIQTLDEESGTAMISGGLVIFRQPTRYTNTFTQTVHIISA